MKKLLLGAFGILILIGIATWFLIIREEPLEFETSKVQKGDIASKITASGKIATEEEIELAFRTSGKITWLGAKIGDEVLAGEVIATLDKRQAEIAVSQKEAVLRATESDLEKVLDDIRLVRLSNPNLTETQTQQNLREKAEAARDQALEAVNLAREELKNTLLTATSTGIITTLNIQVGKVITAGEKIGAIANFSKLIFVAEIDETEIVKIRPGQKVNITLDAFIDEKLTGEVVKIHPQTLTTPTGAIIVKTEIRLINLIFPLKLGFSGEGEIVVASKENVLTVPVAAVVEENGKKYVFVVEKQIVKKKEIKSGVESDEKIEVTEGLAENEVVVTSNLDKVRQGQRIS